MITSGKEWKYLVKIIHGVAFCALPLGNKSIIHDSGSLVAVEAYQPLLAAKRSHNSMVMRIAGVDAKGRRLRVRAGGDYARHDSSAKLGGWRTLDRRGHSAPLIPLIEDDKEQDHIDDVRNRDLVKRVDGNHLEYF
jgi:hypothetical protein